MSTRSRSRGALLPGRSSSDEVRWNDCSGNWTVWSTSPNEFKTGSLQTMNDSVIHRYHERVSRGEIFMNPMSSTRIESNPETGVGRHVVNKADTNFCSGSPRRWEHRQQSNTSTYAAAAFALDPGGLRSGPLPVGKVISDSDVAVMQREATTKVLAGRGHGDSNLFESLAEADQTLGLFRRPLSSLDGFLNRKSAKAFALSGAAAWLTYRYGVMPFIRDMTNIVEGLGKKVGKRRKTTRAKLEVSKNSIEIRSTGSYGGWASNVSHQVTDIVSVRAMSLDEYVADLASNIGFTGKGLVTLPWELIPFSFVADWFVNVGDYLNAHVPAFGYKQLASCLTTTRYRTSVYTMLDHFELPGSAWDMVTPPSGTVQGSIQTKTRSPLGDPGLLVKTNFRLDEFPRLADSISLFAVVSDKANRMFGPRSKRS